MILGYPGGRTAPPTHRIRLSVHWSLLGLLAGKIRKELKELDNIIAYCAKQTDEIVLTALMHGSIKVQ